MTIAADFRLGTKPAATVTEEVIPGLVWGVRCSGVDAIPVDEELTPPGPGEWLWLHFNLADLRAQKWLAECTLVGRPGLERLLSKDDAQQLVPSAIASPASSSISSMISTAPPRISGWCDSWSPTGS